MRLLQTTGAFKVNGPSNAAARLSCEDTVTAYTGDHARQCGRNGTIPRSLLVPANEVDAIRQVGTEVPIVGISQDDQPGFDRLVAEEGLTMVSPLEDAAAIAYQGKLSLEIAEALPNAKELLFSGGGLAAGIAAAVKWTRPTTTVVGISMACRAITKVNLDAGRPVQIEELPTLADSLGGGIGLDNRLTFDMCSGLLDGVILLAEEEIAAGIRHAYEQEREIVEGAGAGAVGIGALLAGKIKVSGPTVLILSGRNIDMDLHRRIVCGESSVTERAA